MDPAGGPGIDAATAAVASQAIHSGISWWQPLLAFVVDVALFIAVEYLIMQHLPNSVYKFAKVASFEFGQQLVVLVLVFKGARMFSWEELFAGSRHDRLDTPVNGVPNLMSIEIAHCCAQIFLAGFFVDFTVLETDEEKNKKLARNRRYRQWRFEEENESDARKNRIILRLFVVIAMVCICFMPYAQIFMIYLCGVAHLSDVATIIPGLIKIFPQVFERNPRWTCLLRTFVGLSYIAIRVFAWLPICMLLVFDNLAGFIHGHHHNGPEMFAMMLLTITHTFFNVSEGLGFVNTCCTACCAPDEQERERERQRRRELYHYD